MAHVLESTELATIDETPPVPLKVSDGLGDQPPNYWEPDGHEAPDHAVSAPGGTVAALPEINGFPVSPDRQFLGIKTFVVPGAPDIRLPLRSDVAALLLGAAAEFNRIVEALHKGWCWGYAYRNVIGGTTPSFHAAGIAIDLNAPAHPLGTQPSANFTARQIAGCRAIAAKYGLRWGGDYTGRKDGMHFEIILSHAEALELVRRLQHPADPPPDGVYIVAQGDTLGKIATRFGTTVAALVAINHLADANQIFVGQRLRLR